MPHSRHREPATLGVRERETPRAVVLAHVGRLHPPSDEGGVRGLEVVDVEGDRRRREVEVVRVVLHQLERHELEREWLVGEPDLHDRDVARLVRRFSTMPTCSTQNLRQASASFT